MSEKFVQFLKDFTDPRSVISEVDKYVGLTNKKFINKSGGSASLGIDLHDVFQEKVCRIISATADPELTEEQKKEITATYYFDLKNEVEHNIKHHSEIEKGAGLTADEAADHFIDVSFKPLLATAQYFDFAFNTIDIVREKLAKY